ncbi:hypothetical protein F442_14976 [Phytophthora nicotianae P10297]|uniref:Uncharacterized protein n=2 Tax=Phytophthora nicotianae TaxID=4792 RepID=W2YQK5_PHYNI|nr:hypothetical protein L917_14410 [Phytophthora nicotianae]ETP37211.1 hypothetical protein F442_14976 [Phytophthora nicotianae P10297]
MTKSWHDKEGTSIDPELSQDVVSPLIAMERNRQPKHSYPQKDYSPKDLDSRDRQLLIEETIEESKLTLQRERRRNNQRRFDNVAVTLLLPIRPRETSGALPSSIFDSFASVYTTLCYGRHLVLHKPHNTMINSTLFEKPCYQT